MLDIIMTLKECIVLVLLTGVVTGLLYAWARSREIYLPEVRTLEEEIRKAGEETKQLEEETLTLQEKIQDETDQIAIRTDEISQLETNIRETEKTRNALESQTEEIRRTYATTHSMLSTQRQRQEQLQKEIGERSVTGLLEEETRQHHEIEARQNLIAQESEQLDEIIARSKRIEAQKEEHEAHRNRTAEVLASLEATLAEKEALLNNLENEMEEKIASLKEESQTWLEKIKIYREKLLKLKENR